MSSYDLRDPDEARQYLLEGLLYSFAAPLNADSVKHSLSWAMEIVSQGDPLPCLGLVADIGLIATHQNVSDFKNEFDNEVAHDPATKRQYEDYVLGKMFADYSFEQASDALAKYEARDHRRAVAYLVSRVCDRTNIDGAILSLAVVKSLLDLPPEEVIERAVNQVRDNGRLEYLSDDFKAMIVNVRNAGELLGREDVFELEQGTALAEFGQRVALRQVLRASAELEKSLPNQRPSVPARKYSIATNIMEEDFYPIGGFTSISNKGTIESLLRSELAYLEDDDQRPDLFDIKYVRDELLYYSRDENQFLRRRLSFVFLFDPALASARFKDSELPVQRIILLMALLVAIVRKLQEWMGDDAIVFELLFIENGNGKELDDERTLFETLFREEIDNGLLTIGSIEPADVAEHCDDLARRTLCHAVMLTPERDSSEIGAISVVGQKAATGQFAIPSRFVIDASVPILIWDEDVWQSELSGIDGWVESAQRFARFLV